MSDEVTQHQVQGICQVTQSRGEWTEFHVELPGKQYPVKLSSKQPAIKEAAQAAVNANAIAVWTYSQRDGKENPHKPGTFYKNRYLESVVIGGTLDPALAEQQQTHQQEGSGDGAAQQTRTFSTDERGVSIERQVIIKAITPLWGNEGLGLTTLDAFFAFADRLDDWMSRVRAKPPETGETSEPVNDGAHQEGGDEYAHQDDDIPF